MFGEKVLRPVHGCVNMWEVEPLAALLLKFTMGIIVKFLLTSVCARVCVFGVLANSRKNQISYTHDGNIRFNKATIPLEDSRDARGKPVLRGRQTDRSIIIIRILVFGGYSHRFYA